MHNRNHKAAFVILSVLVLSACGSGGNTDTIAAPKPTLSAITPATGVVAGGTEVTITGSHFFSVATVTFGDDDAEDFTVKTGSELTATTPSHAAGLVDVHVTTEYGGTATLVGAFTFAAPSSAALSR